MGIVEHIYEALLDDEALDALPRHLAEAVGARSATLQTIVGGAPVHVATHYFSAPMNAFYVANDVIALDPWIPIVKDHGLLNRVADADDYISRDDFRRGAFYNEFFRLFGDDTGVSLGAVIETRDGFVGLGLHRALSAPGYAPEDRATLETALPHLRRLAETRARLRKADAAERDIRAVLHGQSSAILLVNAQGRVGFANLAAEGLLASRDGLESSSGTIRISHALADRLSRALASAATGKGGDALLVVRPSGRPAYRLVVTPHRGPGALPGQALVIIEDPEQADPGLAQNLRRLFGLSPAEADLAVRLAEGCSLPEIADMRAVQPSTVRSQMNAVLAKTGSRRQTELATLLARLPRVRDFQD